MKEGLINACLYIIENNGKCFALNCDFCPYNDSEIPCLNILRAKAEEFKIDIRWLDEEICENFNEAFLIVTKEIYKKLKEED